MGGRGQAGYEPFPAYAPSNTEGIETIWIADPDGYVKAASEPLDQGVRVPEKEFLATRHQDDADIYLSTVIEGTPPRIVSIDMVRRRLTLSGAFNGSIHAALKAAYFVHLFQVAAPLADDVVLVHGDGEVLANSHGTSHYLTPTSPLMRTVAGYPAGRMFADREKLYSYLQVPGFPVHIGLAVSKSAILRRWYEGLVVYSVAAFAASLALLGVSWMAIRSAKLEHTALVALNTETEKRLGAERQLHAAQRLEAVGQLAAGIAHNFNNLLAGILGNLELLMYAKDQKRIYQLTERARRAGERGAHLVSTLLTFVGKQALHVQTVNLNALLSDFVPLIEQSMGGAIRVELMLDPTLQVCRVDLGELKAALLNLALNARDAMVDGGTLTVATKNASQWVAVSFRDTGSGMTEDVKARIFEPFFTTKGSR